MCYVAILDQGNEGQQHKFNTCVYKHIFMWVLDHPAPPEVCLWCIFHTGHCSKHIPSYITLSSNPTLHLFPPSTADVGLGFRGCTLVSVQSVKPGTQAAHDICEASCFKLQTAYTVSILGLPRVFEFRWKLKYDCGILRSDFCFWWCLLSLWWRRRKQAAFHTLK